MNKFNKAFEKASIHFPKLKLKYKDKSLFMKLLSLLMFFNKDFSSKYITTIGNTIYYPSENFIKNNEQNAINILCHELMHVKQANENKLFSFQYLYPQLLAIPSLFALFSFYSYFFLPFLIFLIFLFPFNAYYRSKYEFQAYTVSLYCKYKQGYDTNNYIDNVIKNFTGSSYYWMDTNSQMLKTCFINEKNLMISGINDLYGLKEIVDNILEE